MRELIASALDPAIAAALARGNTQEERRTSLLALRVCDPACGSGHFLLAAARRIGRELARLTQEETEPGPAATRVAVREVIAHCIYGVDRNPLAVDLCKLALWLEAHIVGQPLAFLDAHIKWGNSLVGATEELMASGIPDAAFEAVTGDDRKVASAIRRRNKEERAGQLALGWNVTVFQDEAALRRYFAGLAEADDSTATTRRKKQLLHAHEASPVKRRARVRADLWTAAFFWPLRDDAPPPPTHGVWSKLLADDRLIDAAFDEAGVRDVPLDRLTPDLLTLRYARTLAREVAFFHWDLEFEDIFDPKSRPDPGFDCILGNPPWEMPEVREEEFFRVSAPEIAQAATMSRKQKLIALLDASDPLLANRFRVYTRSLHAERKFLNLSGRFPLTSYGRLNTYSLFAEQSGILISKGGRAGIIIPSGIATDSYNQHFFAYLVDSGRLVSLVDFENREKLFAEVDSRTKFVTMTVVGADRPAAPFEVAFFLTHPDQVRDEGRCFTLSAADIALFNPNTRTCPIFRSAQDMEITRRIYERIPVFLQEAPLELNPWSASFRLMFMMNTASHLFKTLRELEGDGFSPNLSSNFRRESIVYLPLYEAKMIHQFDHRFATYERSAKGDTTRDLTVAEHADPARATLPRYWIDEREVERAVGTTAREHPGWFLGFRDITNATNERTAIFSLVPWAGVSNKLPLLIFHDQPTSAIAAFLANANSLVFDFSARQKVGGTSLNFFIVKQFPVLPPSTYTPDLLEQVVPRVLELVYTAHDIAPFARDCGYDGPPFVWDEDRRAELRADLDGIYAHLYGLNRDDFAYILDTFPIVRRKDEKRWGEYRTKRLCLEAYERFAPLAAVGWVAEEVPPRNVVSMPILGTVAASGPPSTPRPAPMPVPAPVAAADVVLAVPTPPGVASPSTAGADRYHQAAIMAWVAARGKGDFHFGRLKLVKELYFIQEHLGQDLRLDFVREAAGPLDPAVYKVEGLARKKGWLEVSGKRDERIIFAAGRQIGEATKIARQRLGRDLKRVEQLLDFFRPFDSQRIEQWATIHQVWRDRRARDEAATADAIGAAVRAWKPEKRGFDDATIRREIDAMVRQGMIALDG